MDIKTTQVLKLINSHLRIKKFLTILSYCLIVGGIFIYVFYALNQNNNIKIISDYKENFKDYKTEKVMTNPRINFQHSNNNIYHIKAKKAVHASDQEMVLFSVFATGNVGNITAGELKIDEEGDHLVFSKNPILILNKTNNIHE